MVNNDMPIDLEKLNVNEPDVIKTSDELNYEEKLMNNIHDGINNLRELVKKIKICPNIHVYSKCLKEIELLKGEYEKNLKERCSEIDYIIKIKKEKYDEFNNEISPACMTDKVLWYNGLLEYDHKVEKASMKNNLFTSLDSLPEPFSVKVKLVKADKPGYTIIGVTNRFYHEELYYLGDKCTGDGSLGFGTTGLCGCEGKIQHYSGSHLKPGDILNIHGDYSKVSFNVNDELRFSYTFKIPQKTLYLAANCYYPDILEIIDS